MNVKGATIGLLVVFFVSFFSFIMYKAGTSGQQLQYFDPKAASHGAPASHAPAGAQTPAPAGH